jgi:hypothetical protein
MKTTAIIASTWFTGLSLFHAISSMAFSTSSSPVQESSSHDTCLRSIISIWNFQLA